MDVSPRLSLPYLAPQQAQKHVTVNEALRRLDALTQLSVKSRVLAAQPSSPAEGDAYIIPAAPSGPAWGGFVAGDIAVFQDGAWARIAPRTGYRAYCDAENALFIHDGAWAPLVGGSETAPKLGVNTTADATTRFQAKADASLFNHDDVTPGTGDHRLKVNKSGAARTASVIFQDAGSGRAELGLAEDDDCRLKVSADGAVWTTAILIDRTTGLVAFPSFAAGVANPNLLINGDFQLNQRGFAGGALAAGVYGFDRWKAATGGANATVSAFVLTLASGELEQIVEPVAFGYASLASQRVTVSAEAPSADLTVTVGSQSGTIVAGAGRRSVVLALGAGDSGNLSFKIRKASGANVAFGRVKLEAGAGATEWRVREKSAEELLAHRYYRKITGQMSLFFYPTVAAGYFFNSLVLPVRMRATPAASRTISAYGNVYNNDVGNISVAGQSNEVIRVSLRAATTGESYANIETITLDAEL